jgi:hypothetical protein
MKDKPVDLLPAELRRKTQQEFRSLFRRRLRAKKIAACAFLRESAGKSLNPWL